MQILLALLIFITSSLVTDLHADILKNSLKFLASDALEGRRAGSPGNKIAENYIETKIKNFGAQPLGKSYKQEFTIFTKMIKNGENLFEVDQGLRAKKFQPISYSLTGDIEKADLVFAGFGITIPKSDTKLKYDDYATIDAKNKVVIVYTGDPGIGNRNSLFRDPDYINYRSIFYKLKNAIAHGAKGILVVQDPMSIANYPMESDPFFNAREGGGKRFSIIAGYVTNRYLDDLLRGGKLTSIDLQKKLAKSQKPQSFHLKQKVNLRVHLKKETGRVANIVGVFEGHDAALKKEVVVIGAHMDHLGHGGESSMDPTQAGEIHNGADDNASGTALVLALAEKIKKLKLKRTYIVAFFNAEEIGLIGSTHFVDMWARHGTTYGKMMAMLNYDMVGRYQKDLSIMATGSSKNWAGLLSGINTYTNFKTIMKKSAVGSSDHAPFLRAKVPALFFTTGAHEDYHRSTDTEEKIDYLRMENLKGMSLSLLKKMDKSSSLTFDGSYSDGDTNSGSRGYGAHLGCVPKFGQSDDIVGVKCMRASESSPAESAGIVAGDILVQIGDIDIKSIYDLAFALKYYRAGDMVELAWKRGETLIKKSVVLAKSKPRH